jgi:alpha-tubulin suppressor-like RCC1 family protein
LLARGAFADNGAMRSVLLAWALMSGACDWVLRMDEIPPGPGPDVGRWATVATGDGITCAIDREAALHCWGYNFDGQIGAGHGPYVVTPTLVAGATWRAVTVGAQHVCGIQTDDSLWCWGHNYFGQLGDATHTGRDRPVRVAGGPWRSAVAAHYTTCALDVEDHAFCWGLDVTASGSAALRNAPVPVEGGHRFETLTVGNWHACGIATSGAAYCWGGNYYGALGTGGDPAFASEPVAVAGGHTWRTIAAGAGVTCGVSSEHRLWCWGRNTTGAVADGTTSHRDDPVPASTTATTWADVTIGALHACARQQDDSLWCWGDAVQAGLEQPSTVPVLVAAERPTAMVAAGRSHTCRITPGGALGCVGHGAAGELGDGSGPLSVPVEVPAPEGRTWSSVRAGADATYAIAGSELYCWGANAEGQCGDGTRNQRIAPVRVGSLSAQQVAAGPYHACAIADAGTVWCWGRNVYGSLGNGTFAASATPVEIINGGSFQAIAAGYHSCALAGTTLWCWGQNDDGQLGDSTYAHKVIAVQVGSYASVATGWEHTCALTTAGQISCWGRNGEGQLGRGATSPSSHTPQVIDDPDVFTSIVAGPYRTCALAASGVAKCWGWNQWGELGDGTAIDRHAPTAMAGTWSQLALGYSHTCARSAQGALQCWGLGHRGQLGNGETSYVQTPVGVPETWREVAAGRYHTCALRDDQTLWCWGDNRDGQVGPAGWARSYVFVP